jgi:hypothetical protein
MRRGQFAALSAAAAAGGGEPMPIDPGEHEITALVDATFGLELG